MPWKLLKPAFVILSLSLGSFLFGLAFRLKDNKDDQGPITILVVLAVVLAYSVFRIWESAPLWFAWLTKVCREHTDFIDSIDSKSRYLAAAIALAAGLGMFAELVIIRMQADAFQLFAHFKNISLLSCFLGLGIGYSLKTGANGKTRNLSTPLAVPLLALQIIAGNCLLRLFDLNFMLLNPTSEQATMGLYNASAIPDRMMSFGLLTFFFVLNALAFIPFGQLASRLMEKREKLVAYSWNLAGSLIGIAIIVVISYLWTPPALWFALIVVAVFPFLRSSRALLLNAVSGMVALAFLAVPLNHFRVDYHSPYQIISVMMEPENPRLFSNNTWFQSMLDLRPEALARNDSSKPLAEYYNLAYLFKPSPKNVLIVGSGSGNDVAAALRNGAEHVDAVEIDPVIIEVGRHLHPERPYADARVEVHNDDARSFIRRTDKKYDLIVYGLLDSATLMSGNSAGMRMDSYVWTQEAFNEAKQKLAPGGAISMAACIYPSMGPKIFRMLKETFPGLTPYVYRTNWDAGFTFLVGEGLEPPSEPPSFQDLTEEFTRTSVGQVVSTDDWPFLFIFEKSYPFSYMAVILALFVVSYFLLSHFSGVKVREYSASCFFLGAGFMLVETKSIAQLALVFGSTWIVTSVVIAAILVLAFLANLLILYKVKIPGIVIYLLILASLGFGIWIVDAPVLHELSAVNEKLLLTLAMTLPLFFSGLAFSQAVLSARSVSIALASNLLGAMLGGFLEYNALYFGYKSLFYIAGALYILAFLTTARKSEKVPAGDNN